MFKKLLCLIPGLICQVSLAMTWDVKEGNVVYYNIDKRTPRFAVLAIEEAITQWNNVSGNPVVLVRSKDDQVPIHFQWCRKKGSYPGEPGTFALTKRTVDDFNHIQTATVSINAIDFAWPSVKWSLFEILGHEVGHCLGLQHFFAKPGDLMYLHELSGYGPRDADQAELLKLYSGEKP